MNRPTSDLLAADKAYRQADALTSIRDNIGPLSVVRNRRFEPKAPAWLVALSWGGLRRLPGRCMVRAMSADIGPGDFVEAVFSVPYGGGFLWIAGDVRQVEALVAATTVCSACGENPGHGLRLNGVNLPVQTWKCCPCAWKPIYRPKPGAFDQLLKAPKREEQPA